MKGISGHRASRVMATVVFVLLFGLLVADQ